MHIYYHVDVICCIINHNNLNYSWFGIQFNGLILSTFNVTGPP